MVGQFLLFAAVRGGGNRNNVLALLRKIKCVARLFVIVPCRLQPLPVVLDRRPYLNASGIPRPHVKDLFAPSLHDVISQSRNK